VEQGRLVMLNEGMGSLPADKIHEESLRGVEMLRHLPVSVAQFDIGGQIMYQNPEDMKVFGAPHEEKKKTSTDTAKAVQGDDDDDTKTQETCHFRSRFVDSMLGKRMFEEVAVLGNDFSTETQQYTKGGLRWKAIKVRRTKDPVTMNPVILYSARDITDLIEAKKEADAANMQKSEFIAVMAHEIRTPLHQVVGFIELLGMTKLNKEQAGFVRLLQGAAMSLMAVINDLLDYTKLEAGKMDIEHIAFEVRAVIEGSLAAMECKAEEKGIRLESNVAHAIPVTLKGDPNRLRQILLNLLNNAVKFTAHGSVGVTVIRKADNAFGQAVLRFSVKDTGVGISSDHQKIIFAKYCQADASVARNHGGTGLGLSICERLSEAMGGCMGVESEVGKGSTFWLEVPMEYPSKTVEEAKSPDVKAEASLSLSGIQVLVAEDNKVNQKVVSAMLRRLGIVVTVVENGQEAVDHLEGRNKFYDIVLMDVQMPVKDGIEATKEIRSRGWKSPVIGLTASYQSSKLDYYLDVGMNDCISKPVRFDDLRNTITQNIALATLAKLS
jgi:signal transduction histidine kinase/CheY-like chemotaxis protein